MAEPVLDAEELASILRQSMTLNLDDILELPPNISRRARIPNFENGDSLAGVVDKNALLDWVDLTVTPADSPIEVAHDENIPGWSLRVENYLGRAAVGLTLLALQQALDMPLVEVWLGALHSKNYQLQQLGNFYDPRSVVISSIRE